MPPLAGQYTIPPPGMPASVVIQPQGFTMVKSSYTEAGEQAGRANESPKTSATCGCHEHASHRTLKWDVDYFLKNGGSMFTGGSLVVWFDDTEIVLEL